VFIENSLKVFRGQFAAVTNPALLERKRADEATLRREIAARSQLEQHVGAAWEAIAAATRRKRDAWLRSTAFSRLSGSELFGQALTLVRLADEQTKPNERRLPEFTEAALPARRQQIEAPKPYDKDLENGRARAHTHACPRAAWARGPRSREPARPPIA
jgi:peptidase S46-like protein